MSKSRSSLLSVELTTKSKLLLNRLAIHGNTLSVKNSMNLIGRQYRKEVGLIFKRRQVRDPSLRWADLKPSTLKEKKRKGFGNKRTLERTGNLRQGMTSRGHSDNISKTGRNFGVFGSKNKYGNFHDDIDSSRKKMPLRNFSIPSQSTFGVFLRTIDEDIKAQLRIIGVEVD